MQLKLLLEEIYRLQMHIRKEWVKKNQCSEHSFQEFNGILCNNKKKLTTDRHNNMDKFQNYSKRKKPD